MNKTIYELRDFEALLSEANDDLKTAWASEGDYEIAYEQGKIDALTRVIKMMNGGR